MDFSLPQAYLLGLIGILAVFAILVGRQLLRVRSDEIRLIKLEKSDVTTSKEASKLYELASVQLRKRLYPQATSTLKKALKNLANEPDEAKALIENALGFALAAQDNFQSAINHYKSALQAKEDYPVALNNLAFAQTRLNQDQEAIATYQKVLKLDPKNKTAQKQLKRIELNQSSDSSKEANQGGF